jgi:N-acyl-D-aspartate/D-glutamate deacylase
MADYDLLIRGGLLVDGSGLPGVRADVGVKDGRIVELGRLKGSAARVIDASELVVAPGFVDHHTHLDAQLFWDPYGTSEPQHGVTSVVMGNCALALAPAQPADYDALIGSFVRVEAMPRRALEAGTAWNWKTYGEYLDALEGKLGINAGGLVGHIPIRQRVMGEESVEREATDDEIQQMQAQVAESLRGGALGISTNRNRRHMRDDGKPIASRLATDEEFFALCDVLGDLNAGAIQTALGVHTMEHVKWYDKLARRSGRPVVWQSVRHRWNEPTLWQQQLDGVANTFRDGYQAYSITNSDPLFTQFSMKNAQIFDEFPTWKNLGFLPDAVRRQAMADPETRAKLRAELAEEKPTTFHRRWEHVYIASVGDPRHADLVGKSVKELGAMRGQHPTDAFLDLSLEDDLETIFATDPVGGDLDSTAEILRSPFVLVGQSDAGAHIEFSAHFGYSTTLLGMWVRDRQVLTLEQAVHKLTFQVASVYGLADRGLARPGYAADLTIFDPATVNACEPEWADDFPAETRRLIQRSEGVHYTIVNGQVIYEDGHLTGALPGHVLRGAAYTH